MTRPAFPIDALLPRIRESLAAHPRLVLEAPPGAGKTTQVPLALLDADWLGANKILMLEPRRVAARAAAGFMAQQLGEAVGESVGYRIRFENKVSARTRVEVVTEGILTRMLQDDPTLEGVGAVIFDEFHERHLAGDLGLALALDVQSQLRDDLRIVLMSATLDGERLALFLDAPRLSSAGRSFPVSLAHFAARRDESLELQVKRAVAHALAEHPGDVLVFLPGQREISRVERALSRHLREGGDPAALLFSSASTPEARSLDDQPPAVEDHSGLRGNDEVVVLPLHGELPIERQAQVLQPDPHGHRRVILATNVAESSVTLPGVRVVIDGGLAREPRYDPNSGFSRLDSVTISQASADQRAGRAGRVAEGWAYRLWPQALRLEPQRRAEIAQVELASLALELAAWGSDDLRFVDAPPAGALAAARDLLVRLGALDSTHALTSLGRRMLSLGTHPRLAAMLLSPTDAGERAVACDLAALVEARDPMQGMQRTDALIHRWQALSALRGGRAPHDANRNALSAIDQASRQWRRRLRIDAAPPRELAAHLLGDVLAHAFPDRIARQHHTDPRRYQLANGRMARLLDESALYGERWLVVSEVKFEERDSLILRATPVDEARLHREFPQRFATHDRVRWDNDRRAIVAQRESRFDNIVLEIKPLAHADPARHADALVDAVRQLGLDALPWTHALSQWRARAQCLRGWMPELGLPEMSDAVLLATLDDWLKPALAGKTRLDALSEHDLAEALRSGIDWPLRQRIDALAPQRLRVPSGVEREIAYRDGDVPVLAVKLQELFGLGDTPHIADGRIALTLHLLSPAGRPLQVTQDLRGFWDRTYPEVRKEMKGRYPKHPWPDDPWNATATHRAKPRT
ncbi:MAG: ATP-dependent helicase HrpB [Luteimonas sp.]